MNISIKACARCGQDHPELVATAFTNPGDKFSHFAMCPETQQPILLYIIQKASLEIPGVKLGI